MLGGRGAAPGGGLTTAWLIDLESSKINVICPQAYTDAILGVGNAKPGNAVVTVVMRVCELGIDNVCPGR